MPELALCILHEHGDVWDLSWCPYGGFEAELPESEPQETLPRLGLLAVAFSDGTGACFAVPHPEALRDKPVRNQKTIFVTQRPFATIDTPDHYIWRVSWGGHTRLAVGCTDGFVGVWNVNELVRNALAVPRGNATKDSNRKGKQVVRDTVVEGSSPKKLPVTCA